MPSLASAFHPRSSSPVASNDETIRTSAGLPTAFDFGHPEDDLSPPFVISGINGLVRRQPFGGDLEQIRRVLVEPSDLLPERFFLGEHHGCGRIRPGQPLQLGGGPGLPIDLHDQAGPAERCGCDSGLIGDTLE